MKIIPLIPNADFEQMHGDIVADRLLSVTNRMHRAAQGELSARLQERMIDDAGEVVCLVRVMRTAPK